MKKGKRAVENLFKGIKEQIDSAYTQLPDDFKESIKPFQGELETVLASIKVDDNANDDAVEIAFDPATIKPIVDALCKQSAKNKELETQLASLDAKITEGVTTKLKAGEYLAKADADKAKNDAVTEERKRFKLISDRRNAIVTASLPVPTDDKVLELPDAEFTKAQEAAKTRMETIKGKGVTLQAVMLSKLAWGNEEDFNERIELLDAAKTAKPQADPFIGGKGGGAGSGATGGVGKIRF